MRLYRRPLTAAIIFCAMVLQIPHSSAGILQMDLTGLGRPVSSSDTLPNIRFQGLANELGIALGSGAMSPAETLGYSGFNFGFEMSVTDINQMEEYWTGQAGSRIWYDNMSLASDASKLPTALWASKLHIRKGLPFSFEVGATLSYILAGLFVPTDMYAVGAELKWCLYEQFFPYVPNLAIRFAANRLMGARQIDLTQAQLDLLLSYSFGIGGVVNVTPYAGLSYYTVHAITKLLDETPNDINDQAGTGGTSLYNLEEVNWKDNFNWRAMLGLRLHVNFIEILFEMDTSFLKLPEPFGSKPVMSYTVKFGFDY